MTARKKPPAGIDRDAPLTDGAEGMGNLDRMFGRVVSISNKVVQAKMKAEKRKRQAKRKGRGSK